MKNVKLNKEIEIKFQWKDNFHRVKNKQYVESFPTNIGWFQHAW